MVGRILLVLHRHRRSASDIKLQMKLVDSRSLRRFGCILQFQSVLTGSFGIKLGDKRLYFFVVRVAMKINWKVKVKADLYLSFDSYSQRLGQFRGIHETLLLQENYCNLGQAIFLIK